MSNSRPDGLTRRQFLSTAAAAPLAAAADRPRPNIIFIMSDDHASHAISAYGSKINKTPHLDRLAAGGMKLANCFVTNSICTPSRAAILTGQYSHKNGVYTLSDALDGARNNVAKELQQAGYQTAIVGKWHLQNDPTGFDYWNILPGQGAYYDPVFITREGRRKHEGYCTDLIGDFSIDWLKKRDPNKPFFLMCHHKAPHRPWQPAPKYAKLYENETVAEPDNLYDKFEGRARSAASVKMRVGQDNTKTDLKVERPVDLEGDPLRKWAYQLYIKDYLRCVQSVDDNVGKILDYLDTNKLADNTIVIYTSDQGFFLGDHGLYDKRLMYEECLRMPFIVRYPGEIKPGSTTAEMALNVDFAPTFLDYAGKAAPPEMQGRSLRGILSGRTPRNWRQSMYYRYWMHNDESHHVPALYGIRTHQYKLIHYYGKPLGMKGAHEPATEPEWELFDLRKDPREMKNLYNDAAHKTTVARLKRELESLQKALGDTPAT